MHFKVDFPAKQSRRREEKNLNSANLISELVNVLDVK